MISIAKKQFEGLVSEAIDAIPDLYYERLGNVAFIVEDEPTDEMRHRLGLPTDQLLFGLYEGVPLPQRGGVVGNLLPDKISIFQKHIEATCETLEEVRARVKDTVWHEVAHYFGLDHRRIYELAAKEGPHQPHHH